MNIRNLSHCLKKIISLICILIFGVVSASGNSESPCSDRKKSKVQNYFVSGKYADLDKYLKDSTKIHSPKIDEFYSKKCSKFYLDCIYYLAASAIYSKKYGEADTIIKNSFKFIEKNYNKFHGEFEKEDKFYTLLGELYREQGRYSEATNYYKEADVLIIRLIQYKQNNDDTITSSLSERAIVSKLNLALSLIIAEDKFSKKEYSEAIDILDNDVAQGIISHEKDYKDNPNVRTICNRLESYRYIYKAQAEIEYFRISDDITRLDSAKNYLDKSNVINHQNDFDYETTLVAANIIFIRDSISILNEKIQQKLQLQGWSIFFLVAALCFLIASSWYDRQGRKKLEKEKQKAEIEMTTLQNQKQEIMTEKQDLEKQIGTLKQQRKLFHLVKETSTQLNKSISKVERNRNRSKFESFSIKKFMSTTIDETFKLADKMNIGIDMLGVGIYDERRKHLEFYGKEVRQGKTINPKEPVFYSDDDTSIPMQVYNEFAGENNRYYEPNFRAKNKDYELRKGTNSASVLYCKINGLGIITIQSEKPNQFGDLSTSDIITSMGENIITAYRVIKSMNRSERLGRDNIHRYNNLIESLSSNTDFKTKTRIMAVGAVNNLILNNWTKDEYQKYLDPNKYFEDLCNTLFDKCLGYKKDQYEVEINLQKDEYDIDVEILQELGSIVTELALNSNEHAYSNKEDKWVKFEAYSDENELRLTFCDRGKGINAKSGEREGIGLELIKKAIDGLHGNFECSYFDKEQQRGTKTVITLYK